MYEKNIKITKWKNDAKAAVSLTFDGGYLATLDNTLNILQKNNLRATYNLVTDLVGKKLKTYNVASWPRWQNAALYGMEIGSHSVTHGKIGTSFTRELFKILSLRHKFRDISFDKISPHFILLDKFPSLNKSKIFYEVYQSKKKIEEKIPITSVFSFAYPDGKTNPVVVKYLKQCGYLSARTTDSGYNFLDNINLFKLKTMNWDKSTTTKSGNLWIDQIIKNEGWLIEVFHIISDENINYEYITPQRVFIKHVNYLLSKPIWIDTQSNIAKYIIEKSSSKIRINGDKNMMFIELYNLLEDKIYYNEITLKILIPDHWGKVTYKKKHQKYRIYPKIQDGQKLIYLNEKPNSGIFSLSNLE